MTPQTLGSSQELTPLRFAPILKRLIWGGRRLGTVLGKPIGPEDDYAESWEIADHRHGRSVVEAGPFAGVVLSDLVRERGEELLGPSEAPRDQFPLLVKFIDAQRDLSVQVHPDDEKGTRLAGDNGKTESWVVLQAAPGSRIYAGLEEGVTEAQFVEASVRGDVAELLHAFEPKPGDCIHIPAGTVHAIGAGVLLAEVQQMSDATFRVHDWGRVGPDGQPRPLHLAEAIESIDFGIGPVDPLLTLSEAVEGGAREPLSHCEQFQLDRWSLKGRGTVGDPDRRRFTILIGLSGTGEVNAGGLEERLGPAATLLLPAALGACRIRPLDEEPLTFLTCTVP